MRHGLRISGTVSAVSEMRVRPCLSVPRYSTGVVEDRAHDKQGMGRARDGERSYAALLAAEAGGGAMAGGYRAGGARHFFIVFLAVF